MLRDTLGNMFNEYYYKALREAIKKRTHLTFSTDPKYKDDNLNKILRFLNRRGMDYTAETTIPEMIEFVKNIP
jgi:hypothetical protein